MTKRLIGFRVEEGRLAEFRRLASESDQTIQDVLADFVEACLEAGSVEITPVSQGKDGRELSNEMRLRSTLLKLQRSMKEGDRAMAEFHFGDMTNEVRRIRDSALIADARRAGKIYLEWIEKEGKSKRHGLGRSN